MIPLKLHHWESKLLEMMMFPEGLEEKSREEHLQSITECFPVYMKQNTSTAHSDKNCYQITWSDVTILFMGQHKIQKTARNLQSWITRPSACQLWRCLFQKRMVGSFQKTAREVNLPFR